MPERTCVGCRRVRPQGELTRVVLTPSGLATGRSLPGRGSWFCTGSMSCVEAAVHRKALGRALRGPVDEESAQRLLSQLAGAWEQDGGTGPDGRK